MENTDFIAMNKCYKLPARVLFYLVKFRCSRFLNMQDFLVDAYGECVLEYKVEEYGHGPIYNIDNGSGWIFTSSIHYNNVCATRP